MWHCKPFSAICCHQKHPHLVPAAPDAATRNILPPAFLPLSDTAAPWAAACPHSSVAVGTGTVAEEEACTDLVHQLSQHQPPPRPWHMSLRQQHQEGSHRLKPCCCYYKHAHHLEVSRPHSHQSPLLLPACPPTASTCSLPGFTSRARLGCQGGWWGCIGGREGAGVGLRLRLLLGGFDPQIPPHRYAYAPTPHSFSCLYEVLIPAKLILSSSENMKWEHSFNDNFMLYICVNLCD